MTTECVSGNGSSRFKIFPEEVKEKAVFAEHLPLRETELFHKLPVVIIGHIILPSDSDPTEELGAHYGLLRSKFKNCLSIKPTLAMSLQKCQRSSHLAGIPNDKAVFAFASLTCLKKTFASDLQSRSHRGHEVDLPLLQVSPCPFPPPGS